MKEVTPQVEIIAETKMDFEQLQSYLDSIGTTEYDPRSAESDGESLIMEAGKACSGLAPNYEHLTPPRISGTIAFENCPRR